MKLILLAAALLSGCSVYPGAYVTSTTQRGYQESAVGAGVKMEPDGTPIEIGVYGGLSKEGNASPEPYAEVSVWWNGSPHHVGKR